MFNNYRDIPRQFVPFNKWLAIFKGTIYTGIIIAYFHLEGKELLYAIYLPIDVLMQIALLVYKFSERYFDEQQKEWAKHRKARL